MSEVKMQFWYILIENFFFQLTYFVHDFVWNNGLYCITDNLLA